MPSNGSCAVTQEDMVLSDEEYRFMYLYSQLLDTLFYYSENLPKHIYGKEHSDKREVALYYHLAMFHIHVV